MSLDNSIESDFQRMLLPLNILELLYCQPKFQISHASIIHNGLRGNLHCILGVIFIILINVYNLFVTDFVPGNSVNGVIFKLSLTDAVFYGVSGILVCGMNMVQNDNNVKLITKMQKAYRVLRDDNGLKNFEKGNWIFVVTLYLSYFMYNLSYTVFGIYKATHLMYNMILFYFDVNVIIAVRIVKFLEYELILWRKELNIFFNKSSLTNHHQLVQYLVDIGHDEKRLYNAYANIIGAFKLCRSIFGMSILVLLVEGFGHPLIYIQFFIDVCKSTAENSKTMSTLILLISLVWILKTLTILSCLCVASQRLSLAVSEVETACAIISCDEGCLVYAHRLAKNVLRYGASVGARDVIRPFNLLPIGAATPLHMLTLLGTYTVVLLQFAFL